MGPWGSAGWSQRSAYTCNNFATVHKQQQHECRVSALEWHGVLQYTVGILDGAESVCDDQHRMLLHQPVQSRLHAHAAALLSKAEGVCACPATACRQDMPNAAQSLEQSAFLHCMHPQSSQVLCMRQRACTAASLSASRAEVASSNSRISGLRTRALAMAMRCRWPPLSCTPLSPHSCKLMCGGSPNWSPDPECSTKQ